MLNVFWNEMAKPISDKDARMKALSLVDIINEDNTEWDLSVCNESYINAIRELIIKDLVSYKNVKFFYKRKEIEVNRYGAIIEWPRGFADANLDIVENILRLQMEKRKTERIKNYE